MSAIAKLGTGGATASTLSAAETADIFSCTATARDNDTASKVGLGGGTSTVRNIAFVTNKITIHACDVAGQQIALAIGSAAASNTIINLLILNVRVLNVNTKAAGITTKMAVGYIA